MIALAVFSFYTIFYTRTLAGWFSSIFLWFLNFLCNENENREKFIFAEKWMRRMNFMISLSSLLKTFIFMIIISFLMKEWKRWNSQNYPKNSSREKRWRKVNQKKIISRIYEYSHITLLSYQQSAVNKKNVMQEMKNLQKLWVMMKTQRLSFN